MRNRIRGIRITEGEADSVRSPSEGKPQIQPIVKKDAGAALVTGGAKRIGRGIAGLLASMGYDIALHYNSSSTEAGEAAGSIRDSGVRCETFRCDLAAENEVVSLIPRVRESFPALNLLVNCASVFSRAPIAETEAALFDRHLAVNLKAPFLLIRDFARLCGRGQIINFLDTKISSSGSAYAAYSLSKKGLAELTLMAAREFAPAIRVNGVAPGLILPPEGEDEAYLDRLARKIPLQRRGSVELVGDAVRFLLENEFVTGQIIYVDGGENL